MKISYHVSNIVVDSDVNVCFLLSHATKHFPRKNDPPLVLFLSSILPVQSASVYAFNVNYFYLGYHNPNSKVPLRYLDIILLHLDDFP
jgi:hypothetical protein